MSNLHTHSGFIGRRGELMAELFLQELEPETIIRPRSDLGLDFLVTFRNSRSGINSFGVEVKSTTQIVQLSFGIDRKIYDRLAYSNMQILLLIANVKQNKLYFAWIDESRRHSGAATVMIPLTPITDRTKIELRRKLTASDGFEQQRRA
jgi:hypothetical protein